MSTPLKRIVAYHIARLKDKSADVRLKAIAELSELADAEALAALETVVKSDPDTEVRKAAQQAGRDIYRKLKSQHG